MFSKVELVSWWKGLFFWPCAAPTNFFAVFRVTFVMPRVCLRLITWCIEMHHMRTYFLCGVRPIYLTLGDTCNCYRQVIRLFPYFKTVLFWPRMSAISSLCYNFSALISWEMRIEWNWLLDSCLDVKSIRYVVFLGNTKISEEKEINRVLIFTETHLYATIGHILFLKQCRTIFNFCGTLTH